MGLRALYNDIFDSERILCLVVKGWFNRANPESSNDKTLVNKYGGGDGNRTRVHIQAAIGLYVRSHDTYYIPSRLMTGNSSENR